MCLPKTTELQLNILSKKKKQNNHPKPEPPQGIRLINPKNIPKAFRADDEQLYQTNSWTPVYQLRKISCLLLILPNYY